MLRLSDFVTCKKNVIIRVVGVYISILEQRKMKFRTYHSSYPNKQFFYVVTVE